MDLLQQLTLAQSGQAIFLLNERAEIKDCTPEALALLPLNGGMVVGIRFADMGIDFIDEDGEEIVSDFFPVDRLHDRQVDRCEMLFGVRLASDALVLWIRGVLRRVSEKEGHNYLLSMIDVSDLVGDRKAQNQIFQAKHQWETTVDALQDIVTIQDLDMNIVRANRKAHELFGFQLGELKGRKCFEAFMHRKSPCKNCPVRQTGKDCVPRAGTVHNDLLGRTFSLSSYPIFDQNGKLQLLVHVARDITQYLRNESEKNRLMAAIEQASESVVISNKKGEILYVNPAFEDTTGYSRGEVIGKNFDFSKSDEHDEHFFASLWQILEKKQVWRGRIVNCRKNGTLIREDVTISPVVDEKGQIVNYVALKRDVTREELLEQQLHQAMKMEALGTLAGGIAHDFNNILAAMIGYAEIARNRLDEAHPARRDIEQLLAGGDRAVDLVKQILSFSRKESYGQFRVFKLQYVVKEIIKLLRPSLPTTIDLVHEIDNSCNSIYADPSQIYQVVMNLCTNARQAIGDNHGRITIRLSERHGGSAGAGAQQKGQNGSYLDLEVTDDGCGIAPEMLDKIFDPFFTTKNKDHGTGLGLAVVHGTIKRHHGEIQVSSVLGKGTTFHVYLAVDGREVAEVKEPVPVNVQGSERIMIVDDENTVTDVLTMMLKKVGYQIETYTDSIAAVRRFRKDPHCCDLVITDMVMPNMTGAELAREFLALRADLPIIMLTGHSENFDFNRAQQVGIRAFLLKPVKMDKLRKIVRKVLEDGTYTDH